MNHHASWLKSLTSPKRLISTAEKLAKIIKSEKKELKANSIVVTGVSGIAIGALVSVLTELPLVVIRKPADGTHSPELIEYDSRIIKDIRGLFIDDLISSGKTLKRVTEELENDNPKSKIVKIYLYSDGNKYKVYNAIPVKSYRGG